MKKRLNLILDEDAQKNINWMLERLDGRDTKWVFQKALSCFHFLMECQEEGKTILIEDEGETKRFKLY